MTNPDGTAIFDSINMVTDRIVLNRNMAEDVVNFEVTAGTVKDIRKGSKKLADALNGENRIIIRTPAVTAHLRCQIASSSRQLSTRADFAFRANMKSPLMDVKPYLVISQKMPIFASKWQDSVQT